MTDLPEPLTPADCDLRGMEWMPLYGDRLLSSETWLLAGPEGRCAALALWWASWKQVPAASLADNDRVLAQLAGYGVAVKAWQAIREEAMRGWVRCADGRLYHPVVAALAAEAWDRRVKERARKAKWRSGSGGTGSSPSASDDADETRTETGTSAGQDADGDVSVRADRDRTGQERKEETSSLRSEVPPTPRKRGGGRPRPGLPQAEIDDAFETLWVSYPRAVGRKAARDAFEKALAKTGWDPDPIITGLLLNLGRFDTREGGRFVPHCSTWLNQERWRDGQETRRPSSPTPELPLH